MYAYIKGELAETNPDHIVIETGGIGYQVFISGQTFEYLPAVGEEIKVYTYLYLREDAMILYGFLTKDDLELFKLLISVSGIGPKGGLQFFLRSVQMICGLQYCREIPRQSRKLRE